MRCLILSFELADNGRKATIENELFKLGGKNVFNNTWVLENDELLTWPGLKDEIQDLFADGDNYLLARVQQDTATPYNLLYIVGNTEGIDNYLNKYE